MARQELDAAIAEVGCALQGEVEPSLEGSVRVMVRAIIHAFRDRQHARKAVVQAILAQRLGLELMAPVTAFIARSVPPYWKNSPFSGAVASRTRSCG